MPVVSQLLVNEVPLNAPIVIVTRSLRSRLIRARNASLNWIGLAATSSELVPTN